MHLPFEHAAGDYFKTTHILFIRGSKLLKLEIVIGRKWTNIEILFVYLFRREKINQLKTSKIPSFLT